MNEELLKLTADLAGAGAAAGRRAAQVVRKSASDIEATAKVLVPVDTGKLLNSISTDFTASSTEYLAEIGPEAEYGHYVEFGTARHAPSAYMGPALDRHSSEFEQAMAAIVDGLL